MIETILLSNDYKIEIEQDDSASSPAENEDTNLFLVANHRDFYVPEPGEKTIPQKAEDLVKKYRKTHWVLALEAYIHSGVRLALASEGNFPDRQWDVSRLGFVFVAKKEWRLHKNARKAALSLIEEWNQYLSGDVYSYSILNKEGDTVDSCSGFYGLEYVKEQALAAAKRFED